MIPTHITHVYVQWMPYSFVWLYLIKMWCTCSNICWSNPKRFLSVLVFFGKYFDLKSFTKIQKFATLHFCDSFTSGLLKLWKRLRKIFKIFRKIDYFVFPTQGNSWLTCDWLASVSPSREKYFKFFSKSRFKGFWRLIREPVGSRKTHVLQE